MLIVSGFAVGLLLPLHEAVDLVTARAQAQSNATETYANKQYGFSIRYPATMTPATKDYSGGQPFDSGPIVYFAADDGAQTEGFVTVNESSKSSDVSACLRAGAFSDNAGNNDFKLNGSSQVKIGAATFTRSRRSDGGDVLGFELDYTALHDKSCYDIQVISYPSGCVNSGCSDRKWSLATETALLNKLDVLVQSFAFL
jgi:hypothetical protein